MTKPRCAVALVGAVSLWAAVAPAQAGRQQGGYHGGKYLVARRVAVLARWNRDGTARVQCRPDQARDQEDQYRPDFQESAPDGASARLGQVLRRDAALVGLVGQVRTEMRPSKQVEAGLNQGAVLINGELWRAIADEEIDRGEQKPGESGSFKVISDHCHHLIVEHSRGRGIGHAVRGHVPNKDGGRIGREDECNHSREVSGGSHQGTSGFVSVGC